MITRDHRAPELHVVEGHEVRDVLGGIDLLVHEEHASRLRERLDDQYPGHDGVSREVPLEERLIHGDVLQSHHPPVLFHVDDAIDEEERIPVRQDLHDLADLEHVPSLALRGPHEALGQRHVSLVTGAPGDDVRLEPATDQRNIADHVAGLVPHELVRPSQRGANHPVI